MSLQVHAHSAGHAIPDFKTLQNQLTLLLSGYVAFSSDVCVCVRACRCMSTALATHPSTGRSPGTDAAGGIRHQQTLAVLFRSGRVPCTATGKQQLRSNSSCAGRPLLGSSCPLLKSSNSSSRRLLDSSNSSTSGPLLGGSSPVGSFTRFSARSCKQGVELDCWREGQALPTSAASELVVERCPCQFSKPLMLAERMLTLSVHYVWAWGAKVTDIPASCGFLVHLHALVNQRDHFMPEGLEQHHLVPAQWVLPEAGSARVLAQDSTAIAGHLHDFQYCTKLRKDYANMHPGKAKLSIC